MIMLLAMALLAALPVTVASTPRVEKVENGGLLFTDNQAGISGVDCGYSLPIGRRTLWVFGDVFLLHPTDAAKPYVGGVSNCGLLTGRGPGTAPLARYTVLTDPATGLARPLLANRPDEDNRVRFWLFGAHHDDGAHRLYQFYARIRTNGPGPFDFAAEGHGLATASTTKPEELQLERIQAGGSDLWWPATGPLYGAAVARQGEMLYVYGVDDRAPGKPGVVARVPAASIADRSAYRYLGAGGAWQADPSAAAPVPGLSGFSELTVAYNDYLGGWLAVHSVGIDQKVRLCLAPQPWGPFKTLAEIGAPHRAFEKAFCYAGKEHPEMREQGGKVIYITYVDGQRYWLQLLKVTLAR